MKIFCYFIEPASYTIDLIKNVYDDLKIDYCFLKSSSLAKSNYKIESIFLDQKNFFYKIKFYINNFRKNNLIIINGYNNFPFIFTFFLCLLFNRKKFIAIDSDSQLNVPNFLLKRYVKYVYLSFIFKKSFVLGFAGGSNSHKKLFSNYGMSENRIFLMPMMVDNKRFQSVPKIEPKTFTFLYVGRLVRVKNIENLIYQFNEKFNNHDARLVVVGSGILLNKLKQKYSSNKINFLGSKYNEDLVHYFRNSSCLVCPSSFEPWGLVINEALSSGLPVITSHQVGANFDLVLNKNTGLISSNMDEFGTNMLKLYNDRETLSKMSEKASELMMNHWNYKFYINCLNSCYKYIDK